MTTWIVILIGLFGFLPGLVLGVLGLKRRFERQVYGRIYVWQAPWSIVSQDPKVAHAFERWRLHVAIYVAILIFLFALVSYLVF